MSHLKFKKVSRKKHPKLQKLKAEYKNCKACILYKKRLRLVHFRGHIPAELLFIGEAPGHEEDLIGKSFIGPAGEALDAILEYVLKDQPKLKWCATTAVSCIPLTAGSSIREIKKDEADACSPRLMKFINLVSPRKVIALGKAAEKAYPEFDLALPHPGWMLKQGSDCDLHIKRAALKIKKELKS